MIELFFNEFLSTFPFHILACVPFHKKLRHSPWKTFLWVCGFELGYLLLFLFLIQIGLSSVWVQYLALPCFGVLFKLMVDAEIGMILFLYLFIIDYLLVVRAAAFCICQALFDYNFFSWETGLVTFLLVLCSIYFMAKAMTRTVEGLSSISIPSFWNTAWLLPGSVTLILLLLTGNIRSGTITVAALLARFMLLICMFLISHFMILFIQQLREQLEANARSEAMERLLQIQRDQYTMLQSRIIENRRARHDFRQHLRVIQDCANRGDLEDLKSYLADYENNIRLIRTAYTATIMRSTPFFPSMQIRRKAPESSLTSTFSCPITRSSRRRNCACFSEICWKMPWTLVRPGVPALKTRRLSSVSPRCRRVPPPCPSPRTTPAHSALPG